VADTNIYKRFPKLGSQQCASMGKSAQARVRPGGQNGFLAKARPLIAGQLAGSQDMRSAFSFLVRCAAASFALCIASYYSIRTWAAVVDPDIWWHIRTGDWIIANHAVPRYAIFSQHLERQWIAYSWLFDVIVSRVLHYFGLVGIPGFLICLQVLLSLVFFVAVRHFGGSFWWSWLIGVLGIYGFYVNPLRSMQFTLLFFIIELWLIFEADRQRNDKLLFWTVPLFIVWANVHIQFTYGLFVLALYVGVRLIPIVTRRWGSVPSESRETSPATLLGLLACAIAGSCIGPNWAYPYKVVFYYLLHSGQFQLILEMQASNFRRPEHYVELMMLMAACYAVGRSRRQDLFRPALLLLTALVSFRAQRDAWFLSITAAFVLAEVVSQQYSQVAEPQQEGRSRLAFMYALAAVVALCVSFGLARAQGVNAQGLMAVIGRIYPVGGTEFVRDSHLPGPMYNSFNWGGFLIFNLREQPVSMDPRGNAYDDEMIARSANTFNAVDWQHDPDLSRANLVLLERSAPLASALGSDPRYRLAYKDPIAVVFVRDSLVAARGQTTPSYH
jgi:hypothetical protein